jgi:hypothetical protein
MAFPFQRPLRQVAAVFGVEAAGDRLAAAFFLLFAGGFGSEAALCQPYRLAVLPSAAGNFNCWQFASS